MAQANQPLTLAEEWAMCKRALAIFDTLGEKQKAALLEAMEDHNAGKSTFEKFMATAADCLSGTNQIPSA